jgi:hypothetical protein
LNYELGFHDHLASFPRRRESSQKAFV